MFRINKGLFGLYSYEGTKLEVTSEDGYLKACLKGAAQGAIDGTFVIGAVVVVAANVLRYANGNQE